MNNRQELRKVIGTLCFILEEMETEDPAIYLTNWQHDLSDIIDKLISIDSEGGK